MESIQGNSYLNEGIDSQTFYFDAIKEGFAELNSEIRQKEPESVVTEDLKKWQATLAKMLLIHTVSQGQITAADSQIEELGDHFDNHPSPEAIEGFRALARGIEHLSENFDAITPEKITLMMDVVQCISKGQRLESSI